MTAFGTPELTPTNIGVEGQNNQRYNCLADSHRVTEDSCTGRRLFYRPDERGLLVTTRRTASVGYAAELTDHLPEAENFRECLHGVGRRNMTMKT
jgi:hypothetical protein